MQRTIALVCFGLGVMSVHSSAQVPTPLTPSLEEVQSVLADRVERSQQGSGMVVGIIDPSGRRVISHGVLRKGDTAKVDGDTLFEIGSITKVFTALLLADATERGEVSLGDPVTRVAPGLRMPERGRAITLRDLVTHTSGLPRLPLNLAPKDRSNPYADYTVEQLESFLATYALPRDVGAQYEYSNLSGGVLGLVLARKAGATYESLVTSRITALLGMPSTRVQVSPELQQRFASGYGQTGEPVAYWDLPTLAGAGALRSTANDLLTFVSAALGYSSSSLDRAFRLMRSEQRPTGMPNVEIAIGWHVFTANGHNIFWHDGGTGGFRSFIGFDPETHVGVVVLSNGGTLAGVTDIGRHLLDPAVPLLSLDSPALRPRVVRTAIDVQPELLERLIGRYQLTPQIVVTVTRDGGRLFIQLTGQPAVEFFAESPTAFFAKIVDAQIVFETTAPDSARAFVLHQNGREQRATRIND